MDIESITKELVIAIFQIMALYRALLMGWNVRMIMAEVETEELLPAK